jgi:hypothetical protein
MTDSGQQRPDLERHALDPEAEWSRPINVCPCSSCTRYFVGQIKKCLAFPNGIPNEIITGQHLHRTPYPGDRGIQYEPRWGD